MNFIANLRRSTGVLLHPVVREQLPPAPWDDFVIDFDYEKDFYEVLTPSGEIVIKCWPNAGYMNATDGSGRKWKWGTGTKVRHDYDNAIGY